MPENGILASGLKLCFHRTYNEMKFKPIMKKKSRNTEWCTLRRTKFLYETFHVKFSKSRAIYGSYVFLRCKLNGPFRIFIFFKSPEDTKTKNNPVVNTF